MRGPNHTDRRDDCTWRNVDRENKMKDMFWKEGKSTNEGLSAALAKKAALTI